MDQVSHLFRPGNIGKLQLENRLILPAMGVPLAESITIRLPCERLPVPGTRSLGPAAVIRSRGVVDQQGR